MSQRGDFFGMRFGADFHGEQNRYLYLIDPQADRFPYGSRELTGKNLELLHRLNRQGFSLGSAPSRGYHRGSHKEEMAVKVGVITAAVAFIVGAVSFGVPGTPAWVSFGIFGLAMLAVVAAAYLYLRERGGITSRHWYPASELHDAIRAKFVPFDKDGRAFTYAGYLRDSWERLTTSAEWKRMREKDRDFQKEKLDRLLFALAVTASTKDAAEQEALLDKLLPEVVQFLEDNHVAVDPARTPQQVAKEILATGPEPAAVEIDYAPQPGYAPYPAKEAQ